MTDSLEPQSTPFRGLAFFTGRDEAMFAGREEEIEEVATRILAGDTLVLYGPSGVGKTSLLQAGVVPALERDRGYRATYVRPLRSPRGDVWKALGADPAEPLAAAIARLPQRLVPSAIDRVAHAAHGAHASAIVSASSMPGEHGPHSGDPSAYGTRARASVADTAAGNGDSAHGRVPHVLLLDQIEELFTRFDEAQCRPLWDGLVELLDDPTPVRLVLSLREDYLHLLDSAHPRLSNLLDRRFRLRGLTPVGARTAMVRPLVARGIRYAPELVDRCVAELTEVPPGHPEEDGVVDPLLLQTVCSELYRRAELRTADKPALDLADYDAAGGLDGVFRRHLDELFKRVDAKDHLLLSLVLQEMTTAHATKRPATLSRLLASGLAASSDDIHDLIDKLVAARLVRRYTADPEPWYELIHDRLVQVLPEQFARDPEFLQIGFMRDLVRQLSKGFSERVANAPLLSLPQLANVVEPFRAYIRFNADEQHLLFRSAIVTEHEVVTWGSAYEKAVPGGSPAILLDLLGRKDTRGAAARAAGLLCVTDVAVREVCMRLALDDPDEAVEESAAEALAAIGRDAEVASLRAALQDASSRPRALRVLGALDGNTGFRDGIATRDRRQARQLRDRARLHAARDVTQRAARDGLFEGLVGGGVAGLQGTLWLCVVVPWLGQRLGSQFAAVACVTALGAAGLGTIWGQVTGRAISKLRVLDPQATWTKAMTAPSLLATCIALPIGLALFMGTLLGISVPYTLAIAGVTAIVSTIAWLLASFTVGLARRVPLGSRRPHAIVRIRIYRSAMYVPWLLAIAVGYALWTFVDIDDYVYLDRSIIIGALFVAAAWTSVCAVAVATACALANLDRNGNSTTCVRSIIQQVAWTAPLMLTSVFAAILVATAPPSFLASVYDITDRSEPSPQQRSSLRLPAVEWTGGVWVRIRNASSIPDVISLPAAWSDTEETYIVWSGTYAVWFPSWGHSQELRFPYRRITWGMDISPSTYAIVDLEKDPEKSTVWRLPSSLIEYENLKQVSIKLIGCRVMLESGLEICNNGYYGLSCGLMGVSLVGRPDRELICTLPDDAQISSAQAVVIFDAVN